MRISKITLLLCTAFSISSIFAAPAEKIVLVQKKIEESNPTVHYKINVQYPQIEGQLDPISQKFNAEIQDWIKQKVSRFQSNVKNNLSTVVHLPAGSQNSTLTIHYKVTRFQPKKWLSVLFKNEIFFAGAAHPSQNHGAINLDWENQRFLKLSDIFRNNEKYMEALAQYSKIELIKQFNMHNQQYYLQMVRQGTAPNKADNYKIWNLSPQGLQLTFEEYQVAPYYAGPQTVLIPYSALGNLLNSNYYKRLEKAE